MTQQFKGDAFENQTEAMASPAFDSTTLALDNYYDFSYTTADFLLSLFDFHRVPFTDRVPRESFVNFFRQAVPNFPVTGTFEAYIFILKSIFGSASDVFFTVPAAGKLSMLVSAADSLDFGFQAWKISGDAYVYFDMITKDGNSLEFKGILGIKSQAQLIQLLSELIPAGIFPATTLTLFTLYSFIGYDTGDGNSAILDSAGNQIVFFKLGA